MSFYTSRNVEIYLNNNKILANSMQLEQSFEVGKKYTVDSPTTECQVITSPVKGSLKLNYYLTGQDFLKNYIYTLDKFPISGTICGLKFNNGYLNSYSLNAEPNLPLNINTEISFYDELSGNFNPISPLYNTNTNILHFNDCSFNYNNSISNNLSSNNIINYQWSYKSNLIPTYYARQTGLSRLVPDYVSVNQKEIITDITCDSTSIPLSFTGEKFGIELICKHPIYTGIYEKYACSGLLNKKNFSLEAGSISKTNFSIQQSHLNVKPSIGNIVTYIYPSLGNKITVLSSNSTENGFFTDININLIERVKLGDTYLPYTVSAGSSNDTLDITITNEAINGYLNLETSVGNIQYPTPLQLDFSSPSIASFTPNTGYAHSSVTIIGNNFYRITDVLFNNKSANFSLIQNTGAFHKIIAYVPDDATIGKLSVISALRNTSGNSSTVFFPEILIDGFSPTTGKWNDIISISGRNFSGITNVYFNGVNSSSFKVLSNTLITGGTPNSGAGFPKGFISVLSSNGLSGKSYQKYRPTFPITGFSVISGTSAEDMEIRVLNADTDYLFKYNNSYYKVAFGDQDAYFGKKDNKTFTGLIPTGFIGNSFISFYEPDGVTKYKGFTGTFYGIGPAPIIGYNTGPGNILYPNISPNNMDLYSTKTINIGGQNMKDFFGLAGGYFFVSGYGNTFGFSNISVSQTNTNVKIDNVRITGNLTNTGYYDVYLRNFAGTGNVIKSGLLINSPPPISFDYGLATGIISGFREIFLNNGTIITGINGSPSELVFGNTYQYALDNNSSTFGIAYSIRATKDSIFPNYIVNSGELCLTYYRFNNNLNKSLNNISINSTGFTGQNNTNLTLPAQFYNLYIFTAPGNSPDPNSAYYWPYYYPPYNSAFPIENGISKTGLIQVFTGLTYTGVAANNFANGAIVFEDEFPIISGYNKIFSSPINNFLGIKIKNKDQLIATYGNYNGYISLTASQVFAPTLRVSDTYIPVAALGISEIKIY